MLTTVLNKELGKIADGDCISTGFCAKWQFAHTIRPFASRGFEYAFCA